MHTDELPGVPFAPAPAPQNAWAHRILKFDGPSSTARLRELLQLNVYGSQIDDAAPPLEPELDGGARPCTAVQITSSQSITGIRTCENALIPFAVVALGQPLYELLCEGATHTESEDPWASVLSAASGTSQTCC